MASLHATGFDRGWQAEEIAALLDLPTTLACVVHENGGRLIAMLIGQCVAGEAEVLALVVAPGLRRAGHGRLLLAHWLQVAEARGSRVAFLEVAADNAAALALYSAAGFVEAGRRQGYYPRVGRSDVDAVLMSRSSTGPAPAMDDLGASGL